MLGVALPQTISLVKFKNKVWEKIKEEIGEINQINSNDTETTNTLNPNIDFKINVVGHSLGGHLAQLFVWDKQIMFINFILTMHWDLGMRLNLQQSRWNMNKEVRLKRKIKN